MKNFAIIILFQIPLLLFSQKNSWSVHTDLGLNLSLNQVKTITGNSDFKHNKLKMGGYWSLGLKYQFNKRSLISLGIDQVAYSYHYYYKYSNGSGAGSNANVFIWGFPIGIENIWLQNDCMHFSTGYGVKYRLNRLGSPFSFESYKEQYNSSGQLIFSQEFREYDHQQFDHLVALFAYAQFTFRIKANLHLGFKLGYTQGLNVHESFKFEAINDLPPVNQTLTDRYSYSSKASSISFGMSWSYIFRKKQDPKKINQVYHTRSSN